MAEETKATDAGSGATDGAEGQARELAGQAQEKAQEAAGQARGMLRDQVDQRSTQAAERLDSTVGDVRTVAEELRKQGKDAPARYAEQAADRADGVTRWLRESDSDRLLEDIEDFGRRNPWALMAGGMALGLLGARFLKASSRERYHAGGDRHPRPQAGPTRAIPGHVQEPPAVPVAGPVGEPPVGVGGS